MSYLNSLKEKAKNSGNILCMGIDPVLEKIPIDKDPQEAIDEFYTEILHAIDSSNIEIPSVKPNIAFFEQYGFEGLRALKSIIAKYKEKDIDVILDAKRGDIGKTSEAYATSVFKFWNADAVTLHPYLGHDSVKPFLGKNKGVYILNRTSNETAKELQNQKIGDVPVYKKVSELIVKWHEEGLGSVVGATYPEELKDISKYFAHSKKKIPLLIPGVGAQGASPRKIIDILKEVQDDKVYLHRINSSSAINYAYLEQKTDDYAGAAVKEIKKLTAALIIE